MPDKKKPVLLCLDLEDGSQQLACKGADYARQLNRPLHVLYVLPQSSSEAEGAAAERLRELTDRAFEGADAEVLAVRRGCVEDCIVDYLKEMDVDLVILGYRYKARRERVYVGSTVKTVISLAPGPVLVVPIDGEK
ncbi:hypothetical protein MNBD_DELTA01-831 [hydrothermal vent metagenome]|uniref:UspA domain-containing protein n=1 Tax=hydrothermal vent metagenome TaxID=652676 RepID=A0A3B0RG73_9ZZZZ